MTANPNQRYLLLKERLEQIEKTYDLSGEIERDPVRQVMAFKDSSDREVAALIAAVFAYGNVRQIQTTLEKIFHLLGPHPAEILRQSSESNWRKRIPKDFKHRFNDARDLGLLFTWLGEALRKSGNLETFFLEGFSPGDSLEKALGSFVARLKGISAPFFLLPHPSGKSACKRLLLFLRWVVGSGPMDLNLWKKVPQSLLIIPLDTHVLRISRHLGLTQRKDSSWKTAVEVTESLKRLDALNPTRFDFALCHLGISRECPSRFDLKICNFCRMNDLCQTYTKAEKRQKLVSAATKMVSSSGSVFQSRVK